MLSFHPRHAQLIASYYHFRQVYLLQVLKQFSDVKFEIEMQSREEEQVVDEEEYSMHQSDCDKSEIVILSDTGYTPCPPLSMVTTLPLLQVVECNKAGGENRSSIFLFLAEIHKQIQIPQLSNICKCQTILPLIRYLLLSRLNIKGT